MQLRLEEHQSKLKHLKDKLAVFENIPPSKESEFTDYLVLSGAIIREEGNCQCLKQSIIACKDREK